MQVLGANMTWLMKMKQAHAQMLPHVERQMFCRSGNMFIELQI